MMISDIAKVVTKQRKECNSNSYKTLPATTSNSLLSQNVDEFCSLSCIDTNIANDADVHFLKMHDI